MNIEQIRDYCLSKQLVTEDSAFGPEILNYRFFNKIFLCIDLERPQLVAMKCDVDYAVDLRDRYCGITGAWHWNKRSWNDVRLNEDVPDAVILELIDHAYDQIRKSLPKKTLYNFPDLPEGWTHEHLAEVDSTMNYLRKTENDLQKIEAGLRKGESVESGFKLVTVDFQTAGRGQRGTSWEADNAQNLLFGFRFRPERVRPEDQFLLSECLALAVAAALTKYCGADIRIKWPNDIYYKDRKICGMLLEHDICETGILSTITGVGINVNQRSFSSDAPNPVSVYQVLNKEVDRAAVLRNVLKNFVRNYEMWRTGGDEKLQHDYFKSLYRSDGYYPYADAEGVFRARILRVGSDGVLHLEDEAGKRREYVFKEVKFILPGEEYGHGI